MKPATSRLLAAAVLSAVLLLPATARPENPIGESMEALMDIKRDISTINLLNGLYLTPEQEQAILDGARRAKELRDRLRGQAREMVDEAQGVFGELKSEIIEGKEAADDLKQRVYRTNLELKRLLLEHRRQLKEIRERVMDSLSESQLSIIEDFDPCLIPPQSMGDPARVGQAESPEHLERMLVRLREAPQDAYQQRIDRLLDRHVERYEMHVGPLSAQEKAAEKERLRGLIEQARSMSDVDFEFRKGELAAQFKKDLPHVGPGGRRGVGGDVTGRKVQMFLLGENIIHILESRMVMNSAP